MNIVFLDAAQNYGGAPKASIQLAKNLKERGHDIHIIDLYGTCQPFNDACEDAGLNLIIVKKRTIPFVLSSRNKIARILGILNYIFNVIILNKRITKIINDINADYIILHNSKVLSFLFKKRFNAKILFYAHGWYLPKQISRFNRFLYKRLVDRIICISEATRLALYAGGIAELENLTVVHNGIDEDSLPKSIASIPNANDHIKILHSGGFLHSKGQHVAIETAKILKERGVKFKMILTGIIYNRPVSREYYEYILDLIDKYDLKGDVIVVEGKTNVIDFFRASDILIHPSQTEGLPLVIMEAMILKKAVIANAVGGITDYILDGYTGIITKYNNVENYADAICMLINNSDMRDMIVANAYNLVKECYTLARQVDAMEKALID